MHEQQEPHITLTQAAKIAPGRPSTNCLWRWCRRGVLARSGERIKLEHLRIGGKLYTRHAWVDEFGRRLADADAKYFDAASERCGAPALSPASAPVSARRRREQRQADLSRVERELQEEGL